jgi:hypothetical protein
VTPEDQTRINVLVAKHIFGMVPCKNPKGWCDASQMDPPRCWQKPQWKHGEELRPYVTDIQDAWAVMRELIGLWSGRLRVSVTVDGDGTECDMVALTGHGRIGRRKTATPASAICLAALEAVGVHCELSPDK